MANIIEVTGAVTKLEQNKHGFFVCNLKGEDGEWHNNISLGVKQAPKTFQKGSRIKLSYDKDNYSNLVKDSLEVLEAQASPKGGSGGYQKSGGYNKGGGYKKGGNDDARQEMIVRQSGINYALQAVLNSAKKTDKPDDIIADAIKMAENTILPYVMKGKSGVPDIFGGEEKKEPAPKQSSAKQEAPKQPEPSEEEPDDDIPF